MSVLKPAEKLLLLLSELIGDFSLGAKGGRSCTPMIVGSILAIHLCRMDETQISGIQCVRDAQTSLLNDSNSCFLIFLRQFLAKKLTHRG